MAKEWYDKNTALNVFWLISGIIWLPIYGICEIIERMDEDFEKPKWVKWWGNRVDNLPDQLIQFLHCGPCIPVINKSLNLAFMMKNRKKPYWPLFRDCDVFYPNCDEEDKKKYNYNKADNLYDQDILTKRKCPKCGEQIVSHPDCTESCSNEECEYEQR